MIISASNISAYITTVFLQQPPAATDINFDTRKLFLLSCIDFPPAGTTRSGFVGGLSVIQTLIAALTELKRSWKIKLWEGHPYKLKFRCVQSEALQILRGIFCCSYLFWSWIIQISVRLNFKIWLLCFAMSKRVSLK